MKTITSTQARGSLSSVLDMAQQEPVEVVRGSKSASVIISKQRFEELQRVEDLLYVAAAKEAEKEGFIGAEESRKFLDSI